MTFRIFSIIITLFLFVNLASAAEIYNKDNNKLDFYGTLEGAYRFSSYYDNTNNDQSYVCVGLKGETKLTNQIIGYSQWEYQSLLKLSEFENTNNHIVRLGLIGMKFNDIGSFDYGRNYGVMYDISTWTNVLPAFGGDTYDVDNFMFQRGNGMLTYRSNNFFGLAKGLNFAIQYQHENNNLTEIEESGRDVLNENGQGWGLSSTYNIGSGLDIGIATFQSYRTDNQNGKISRTYNIVGRNHKAKAYAGGFRYQINNFYLATTYTRSYNAIHFGTSGYGYLYGYADYTNNLEIVAQYQFDFGLKPSLAFISSVGKVKDYGHRKLQQYVSIGATYNFNKHLYAYCDFKINLLNDNNFNDSCGTNACSMAALGLAYKF
ncbi:porin [Candidatus Pantoea carbekii]|uniref:Uncharacterized protein n=1 Tax=Candidatus Pantoea carbekii TaxID=1235990 RepID=U3U853_9GAMM|nr:porin [Candidatus Pantoea carbekii]AKC32007.1 outer membrane protein C precursor OmpC [Candidatus Pantoea carbekii]BAO00529.1 hypothetical protein HHS_05590 [Candidatus Pantoea carbekii]